MANSKNEARLNKLAHDINHALGEEALARFENQLTGKQLEEFDQLLKDGRVTTHNSGYIGFTIDYGDGTYTNAGFEVKRKSIMAKQLTDKHHKAIAKATQSYIDARENFFDAIRENREDAHTLLPAMRKSYAALKKLHGNDGWNGDV